MNEFYEISEKLQDKFEYIKRNISFIMLGEVTCDYGPDWDWDTLYRKFGNYGEALVVALDNGKELEIPQKAQIAFKYLLSQVNVFDFTRLLDFIVFEALFYNLITDAYMYQRYSAQSEHLVSIESAKEILDDKQFRYISLIYDILQLEFSWWLNYRDNFDGDSHKRTKAYQAGIYPTRVETQIGTKAYWAEIKKLASEAHDLLPMGELANRIMLISDVQLIYGVGDWKDIYDPANEELVRYRDIRQDTVGNATFIHDCFSDSFEDYCKPLGWITGFPHLEERTTPDVIMGKAWNDEGRLEFLDSFYQEITLFPASIYIHNSAAVVLSGIAGVSQRGSKEEDSTAYAIIEAQKKELKEKNEELERVQAEKLTMIRDFHHTYKNMRATTLQSIGLDLMNLANQVTKGKSYYMKRARQLLLEYSIKKELAIEVDMLRMQVDEKMTDLINAMQESITDDSQDAFCFRELVDEAMQRCLITLFYDESQINGYRRILTFSQKDYKEKLEHLRNNYENSVLTGGASVTDWLRQEHFMNVELNDSELHQTLYFKKDGFAAVLLIGWLSELFLNALKYANKQEPVIIDFRDDGTTIKIVQQNVYNMSVLEEHETEDGLNSIERVLQRLNAAVGFTAPCMVVSNNKDSDFVVKFTIAKQIFIK